MAKEAEKVELSEERKAFVAAVEAGRKKAGIPVRKPTTGITFGAGCPKGKRQRKDKVTQDEEFIEYNIRFEGLDMGTDISKIIYSIRE